MGFDIIGAVNSGYPELKTQGWVDFNGDKMKGENEELRDANHNGTIGDELDYHAFVEANAQYIQKTIIDIDDVVAANIAALNDEDAEFRRGAVVVLGSLKDPRAVPALSAVALMDREILVRYTAIYQLGEMGDLQAVPALIEALIDDDFLTIRATSLAMLESIDLPEAKAELADLKERYKNRDFFWRQYAQEALVKIGAPAVDFLIAGLTHKNGHVRENVAQALGKIGDPKALDALKDIRGDGLFNLADLNRDVVKAADEAIEKIEARMK